MNSKKKVNTDTKNHKINVTPNNTASSLYPLIIFLEASKYSLGVSNEISSSANKNEPNT